MKWTRRHLLTASGALAGVSAMGLLAKPAPAAPARRHALQPFHSGDAVPAGSKRIALLNLHTAEYLDIEFFRDGIYVSEALTAIESLLRDFRTGEQHYIDPRLMDYLVEVAHSAGVDPAFSVISGYRSPQTNASLRAMSTGVAQHSLHMEGRAIDVRMTSVDCASLAARAQNLQRGGIGYYRGSDFVHLDTGAFRTWKG